MTIFPDEDAVFDQKTHEPRYLRHCGGFFQGTASFIKMLGHVFRSEWDALNHKVGHVVERAVAGGVQGVGSVPDRGQVGPDFLELDSKPVNAVQTAKSDLARRK